MGTIKEALTFDDILMLPRYSNILPTNTNISLDLTSKIKLKVPFFWCTHISARSVTFCKSEPSFGLQYHLHW